MSDTKPGFWSSETLRERLPELINPFSVARVKHAAYELALGGEAFVTGEKSREAIADGGEIVIPPGQFAVLITDEAITVPADAIAFISMKSANKFRGLINVSGFHVDPGFSGRLVFSVFNAGVQDIHLSKGVPLFMIWFASLDRQTEDAYKGAHNGQMRIPDSIVTDIAAKHLTPSALQKEIEDAKQSFRQEINDVRKDVGMWRGITMAVIVAVVLHYVSTLLKPTAPSPSPNTVVVQYPSAGSPAAAPSPQPVATPPPVPAKVP